MISLLHADWCSRTILEYNYVLWISKYGAMNGQEAQPDDHHDEEPSAGDSSTDCCAKPSNGHHVQDNNDDNNL